MIVRKNRSPDILSAVKMFDENQLVTINWSTSNRNWLSSLGYKIPNKLYTPITIPAKHLPKGSQCSVRVICDYCNNEYITKYNIVVKAINRYPNKCACSKCAPFKAVETARNKIARKKAIAIEEICREKGYTLITNIFNEYTGCDMDVKFICPKHGEQKMMLDNIYYGHECIKCSYEKRANGLRSNIKDIIYGIESVNSNKILNPEEFKDVCSHNLKIRCSCGNVFTTSFVNYTKHGIQRCRQCSHKESNGEKIINDYLTSHGISFIKEKRFKDCRDKKPLPFDFYLPDKNLVIEFDGKQHFEEVYPFNYKKTSEHDNIKNQYCEERGIKIIRIPYWEGHNIERILDDKINQVKNIV